VLGDPRPGRDAVVGRAGELRLGCEPVVDRHHDHARVVAQQPAEIVVGIE